MGPEPALQRGAESAEPSGHPTVSGVWALTASAGELDATGRSDLAGRMELWMRSGGSGIVLSTCHRVELYGTGIAPDLPPARVRSGEDAIVHLMRVATGLESAIVGEDEVLHQVREALAGARRTTRVDAKLARVFEMAIATGRRARSRRTASTGNLAQRAALWLDARANVNGDLVVVAGAGRMGSALAHSLRKLGAHIVVASRDAGRAVRLAERYGGHGVDLAAGAQLTSQAAAVAVALGGPWTVLRDVEWRTPPPVADISAPQAVPETVRRRLNGTFLGIDDLYVRGRDLPGAYIKDAESLVERNTAACIEWLSRAG